VAYDQSVDGSSSGAASPGAGVGQSIEAFGLQTNYHRAGAGAPVILLHGSGPGVSAWTNWRRVIPALSDSFDVIAPDMAGFGYTERKADLTYDIKLWVKHLIGLMDALGVDKTSLVGNSFGGSLSLAAALRHPERFDKIVLMGTPCDKFMMTPGLRAGWDYQPSLENMRAVMSLFPADPAFITDALVQERYEASLIPGAQEGLRKLLAKPADEGETELSGMPEKAVAGIIHPTLILHGREDKVIPVEMGLKLGRAIPNAQFHMFGGCGHWVQAERFDDFVALTRRHLA
jgi:2-hydroxy-6-oxo-octa-2,4-dienoate hydrolase